MLIPFLNFEVVNPINDISIKNNLSVYDDVTQGLHSTLLPLEIQLMLLPMWTVRSNYNDCMKPLDSAMKEYLEFRYTLLEIDQGIESGTATNMDVVTAFDRIMTLYHVYEENQKRLVKILREVNHQILYYSQATKNDLMWNELVKLKEIDHTSFTRRACCFEHVVVSLFKLDESIKDSIKTSNDIARCCANYLVRIAKHFKCQLPSDSEEEGMVPSQSMETSKDVQSEVSAHSQSD